MGRAQTRLMQRAASDPMVAARMKMAQIDHKMLDRHYSATDRWSEERKELNEDIMLGRIQRQNMKRANENDREIEEKSLKAFLLSFSAAIGNISTLGTIAKDFLKEKLPEFDKVPPLQLTDWTPETALTLPAPYIETTFMVISRMWSFVEAGDQYSKSLFIQIYKGTYRKEYNILKKFTSLSIPELVSLNTGKEGTVDGFMVARILHIAPLLGIDITESKPMMGLILNMPGKESTYYSGGFIDVSDNEAFSENWDKAKEQVEQWLIKAPGMDDPENRKKALKQWNESMRFLAASCACYRFKLGNILDWENWEFEALVTRFTATLALMYRKWPNREFSFVQVQHCAALMFAASMVRITTGMEKSFISGLFLDTQSHPFEGLRCFGDQIDVCYRTEDVPFNPEALDKLRGRRTPGRQAEEEKKTEKTDAAPAKAEDGADSDDPQQQIAELKEKIRRQEQEIERLSSLYQEAKEELSKQEEKNGEYKDEHDELVALRNHVYHFTDDDLPHPAQLSQEEMEEEIEKKKIVIIGGHSNWTYKLRNRYKKWKFISPEASPTTSRDILYSADMVYFFSDCISHGNYFRFINTIREHGIPFAYIHNVNIQSNVEQIYQETVEGQEE